MSWNITAYLRNAIHVSSHGNADHCARPHYKKSLISEERDQCAVSFFLATIPQVQSREKEICQS